MLGIETAGHKFKRIAIAPVFLGLFLVTIVPSAFAADTIESKLLNSIDRACTHDTDCTLVFETCVRSACNCPSAAANKRWVPKCSNGIVTEPYDPAVVCSVCYPFVARCRNHTCERVDEMAEERR